MIIAKKNLTRQHMQLVYTLNQTRSVSMTAEKLLLSVSSVSRVLADLREAFGDELFVRVGARMEPTPKTQEILPKIESILGDIETLFTSYVFDPANLSQTFHLIGIDLPFALFGAPLWKSLSHASPRSRIEFVQLDNAFLRKLSLGEANVALSPVTELPDNFHRLVIGHRHFVLAMRAGHPLLELSQERELERNDLFRYPCVRLKSSQGGLSENIDVHPNEIIVPDLLAAPLFLLDTDAIMPVCSVAFERIFKPYYGLQSIALPAAFRVNLPLVFQMIWHHRVHKDPANQWFRALLAQTAREVTLAVPAQDIAYPM